MKIEIPILVIFLFLGCTKDEITFTSLAPPINPYSGDYSIDLSGDLEGKATIPIRENGRINNGIPVIFYASFKINIYIDGWINADGTIDGAFYCNRVFETPTGPISIKSSVGDFKGSFSSGNGTYSISIINDKTYSGNWTAIKD